MPTDLDVMEVVGRREAPIFTWNPVEQMWVQENQVASKPPPAPHDIHAIQTWFLDPDENEWIQTVLGPTGRQLAARWHGAYRVPESAVLPKIKPGKRTSPLMFAIAGVVLIALIGGVALAAPSLMGAPTASPAPSSGVVPTAAPQPTAAATPEPTPEPPPEPTPGPTVAPTPRPVPRPAGPTVTLKDGTRVTYTGPLTAQRGGTLGASFTVIRGNGRPGAGAFGVFLNDPVTVSNRRAATGTLNGSGQIFLSVPTNVPVGSYQLLFSYAGETAQIATVTVR
ncbi:MAG TPA: hypothetical protein VGR87_07240 [Candidatus Limnocylindria bacterium]|jgi:hypothetical protein|nr:hypothetical protein [Candidatus Limnocylindria bacterium]